MALINIGSTAAFNAILSLSTIALMGTYVISIGCMALRRIRKDELPHARWSLGKAGMSINIIASLGACWSFFWSFWPNAYIVTTTNFNWASVLSVGLMAIAGVLYLTYAKDVYEEPLAKVVPMEFVDSEA